MEDHTLTRLLTSSVQALKEARWRELYRPSVSPESAGTDASKQVHQKWERVVSVAMQAGSDDGKFRNLNETDSSKLPTASPVGTGRPSENAPANASSTARSRFPHSFPRLHHGVPSEKRAKMMDQRYFLEMVDLKHRHGSNLRKYHNYWMNCPSTQNFFYWLDHGEGKDLDLPECPRAKLEHQQVRYLSRDERLNYLVTVDQAGLFLWAKNNELVCTDSTRFKDSLKGVVPVAEDAPQFRGHSEAGYPVAYASSSSSVSTQSLTDEDSADDSPNEQINQGYEEAKGIHKLAQITPSVVCDHFARKPAKRKDMWLFVRPLLPIIEHLERPMTDKDTGRGHFISPVHRYQGKGGLPTFLIPTGGARCGGRFDQDLEWSTAQSNTFEVN